MACPITIAKFVGTISLGLLTGVSFSMSNIAIPALQSLPTASDAAETLQALQGRTRQRVLALSNLTTLSLFTAFVLSPPRRKHPYLIWTALAAFIGGSGLECWVNRHTTTVVGSCVKSVCAGFGFCSSRLGRSGFRKNASAPSRTGSEKRREDEESLSNGNGSEIEIVGEDEANLAVATEEGTPRNLTGLNGETVQVDMEQERKFQRLRTWILGVGFSMGVVGIWGDGA